MSQVKWTAAQQKAIDSRGNVLVSAAAGSGKTATLSAKIMKLLGDADTSLDQFLIVTFTNAAAAELRERIGREITKASRTDRSMMRHRRDVACADICTIHSFCLKLVRRYFTTLGVSPDFAVCDETAAEVMKSCAMENTVDDFFRGDERITSNGACDILTLADTVGKTKDASGLDAQLRELSEHLTSLGLDEGYLTDCADSLDELSHGDFFASPLGREIKNEVTSAASHFSRVLGRLRGEMALSEAVVDKYMPAADALADYLSRILAVGDSFEDMAAAVNSYEPVNLGRLSAKDKTDAAEEFKQVRDEIKKLFTRLANRYFRCSAAECAESAVRTASVLRAASDVLAVYRRKYTAMKRESGVLDFSDLESLALKLLENDDGTPSAAALEAGERYRFVFIDEYQDTNNVQDRIFRAIGTKAEKFFVGDIKQSIYRFRGAEPEVFSGYRRAWSDGDSDEPMLPGYPPGRSIFMSENFRCARPVIEFANAVSRYMFAHGGIPFTEDDCLVYGGVAEGDVPVEVCLIDGSASKSDDDATSVSEAEYTAERIYTLLKNGEYAPSDIAILLRSANAVGDSYEAALKARGIPVKRMGGSSFADESEVVLTLDILRTVDNPMRDVSLAGAMLSSVFGFTMDELALIRISDSDCPLYTSVEKFADGEGSLAEKCRDFCSRLSDLRCAERGMPADAFIEHLYAECSLFDCAEVREKLYGADNLRTLHELARTYEKGVFGGLYGFLSFIDEKLDSGALTTEGQNDGDGVTIISIHKSKGLEYRVCFLCDCGRERNKLDENSRVLFERELGVGLRLPDPGGLVLCGNPIRDAIGIRIKNLNAMEQMRVLYVAMTRAKERLVVTSKSRRTPSDELLRATRSLVDSDAYQVISCSRMIDLILQGALSSNVPVCSIVEVSKTGEQGGDVSVLQSETQAVRELSDAEAAQIREALTWRYPYGHLASIPSKLAVSRLYPALLDADDTAATLECDAEGDESEFNAEVMPKPRFMTGGNDTTPTDRGTSTHVFLQFADFSRLRAGHIRDEIERLTSRGFITEKMASLVARAQVERFAASDVVGRILASRRLYREFRFNVLLPASNFTEDEALRSRLDADGERITVQGVFDCVFEDADGRLVLLDYKTDSMSAEELAHRELGREKLIKRHARQLTYYAEAIKSLFGRHPDEVYIYSLSLGEAVPVDVCADNTNDASVTDSLERKI